MRLWSYRARCGKVPQTGRLPGDVPVQNRLVVAAAELHDDVIHFALERCIPHETDIKITSLLKPVRLTQNHCLVIIERPDDGTNRVLGWGLRCRHDDGCEETQQRSHQLHCAIVTGLDGNELGHAGSPG